VLSILVLSTIFISDFGTVPTLFPVYYWYDLQLIGRSLSIFIWMNTLLILIGALIQQGR